MDVFEAAMALMRIVALAVMVYSKASSQLGCNVSHSWTSSSPGTLLARALSSLLPGQLSTFYVLDWREHLGRLAGGGEEHLENSGK